MEKGIKKMSNMLKRRDFLAHLSGVMGGVMTLHAARAFAAAERFVSTGVFEVLSPEQGAVMQIMADIIIPETDTPGAASVGVHFYIDHVIGTVMTKPDAQRFITALEGFMASEPAFLSKSLTAQTAIIQRLDDDMRQETPLSRMYRTVKELTLIGYYTSEAGATVELVYDPIPGPYHQISLQEQNRIWSNERVSGGSWRS